MAYIGNPPANRFVAPKAASVFSGDGSTTAFTLDHAVGSDEDILVSVDGVVQEPSVAYAVSNGTTLTFTAAPSSNSGNNIFVCYLFRTVGTIGHPSNNALTATNGTLTGNLNVTGTTTLSTKLATSNLGAGAVLQVVSNHITSQHSTSTTGEEDITDMNVTITPSSTSSKILVLVQMVVGSGQDTGNHFTLKRGSTAVGVGSTDGSRTQVSFGFDGGNSDSNRVTTLSFHHLDSPSTTSATTYKITTFKFSTNTTFRLNRVQSAAGSDFDDNFSSHMTAIEIAG